LLPLRLHSLARRRYVDRRAHRVTAPGRSSRRAAICQPTAQRLERLGEGAQHADRFSGLLIGKCAEDLGQTDPAELPRRRLSDDQVAVRLS
jgi:hypothetical protein